MSVITSGKAHLGVVRSALTIPGPTIEKFWFFKDHCFGEFTFAKGTVHEFTTEMPKIVDGWNSLRQCGFYMVDAAFSHPYNQEEAYFFFGEYCALINIAGQKTGEDFVVDGPKRIGEFFPLLEAAGFTTVDAVYPVPSKPTDLYFFRGPLYLRMGFPDGPSNHPNNFQKYWPSLKKCGFTFIDAVIPVPPNLSGHYPTAGYYFSGERWARIAIESYSGVDTVVHGPLPVAGDNDDDHWLALTQVKFYP